MLHLKRWRTSFREGRGGEVVMVRQKDTSKIQFDEFLDLDAYEVGAPSPVAPAHAASKSK